MARRRYYYRRVVRAAKKKWASNGIEARISSASIDASHYSCLIQSVVENGVRVGESGASAVSTAQILKTSRFRFKGVITAAVAPGVSLLYYITYLPESTLSTFANTNYSTNTLGSSLFYVHPEWVMAWGRKDFTDSGQSNEISLTTKLKRNLNSGDRIAFVCQWINLSGNTVTVPQVQGTISYMCCAN